MIRTITVFVVVLLPIVISDAWAAPQVRAATSVRLRKAHRALDRALARLAEAPRSPAKTIRIAESAMAAIERGVDAYFHGPNVRTQRARPHALALRQVVHELMGGPNAVLLVHNDVIRFRPAIHHAMARANRAIGRHAREAFHLREAITIAGPTLTDLRALAAAWVAAKREAQAHRAREELQRLESARPADPDSKPGHRR